MSAMRRFDRSTILLSLGAGLGLLIAALGLLASGHAAGTELGGDVVARVNGVPIRLDDYRRAVDGVAQDRREPPDGTLRRHVLDRLIDEELLVQRGLELGLARIDPRIRRELAAAVTASAVEAAAPREPTRAELEAFYAADGAFFARGGRLHLRQVFVAADTPDAEARAARAAARLRAGTPLASVREEFGDDDAAPIPDAPLPVAKLADYLGPTALRSALTLPPGSVSDPVRSAAGWHVLVVVARRDADPPPLAEIEAQVAAEWRRRAGERALRTQLDELRARADVEVVAIP
jgi:parvulin-like peptidyl-prolyl isomerase